MTDGTSAPAPGAAADLMTPPQTVAEQARATLEAHKADPEWTRKYLAGDHEARAEMLRLTEAMHAPVHGQISIGGPSPEYQRNDQAEHLAATGDLPPAVVEQIRRGDPVSADEYRMAVGRKRALIGDPGFREKYMRGDADARRQMLLLDVILSSSIKLGA
jgi:hypothetical protein